MTSIDDAYLETQVMTSDPHALHLLVVDGALRNARRAVDAMERDDIEQTHLALGEARDYVSELLGGLDDERGGEIARNVRELFVFVYRGLLKAELEQDADAVRDAVRVLELHRQTWLELGETLRNESQAAPSGPAEGAVPPPHLGQVERCEPHVPREWTT